MAPKWNRMLSRIDAYPRPEEHLAQKTLSGAIVSLCGVCFMILLFVTEVNHFLSPQIDHELSVDSSRETTLPIWLNVTMPHLPCAILGVDALDESGNHDYDLSRGIKKHRIDKNGNDIGDYKPVTGDKDFNSFLRELEKQLFGADAAGILEMVGPELIAQAKSEVQAKEGCRVYGKVEVSRVTGNIHLSVHHASSELLEAAYGKHKINFSHNIHKLHFGPGVKGVVNPLDGLERIVKEDEDPGQFKYFLKLVPTVYKHLNGKVQRTHQYSVAEYFHSSKQEMLPSVVLSYEFSPIVVMITERRRSLLHLLTKLSAVIGGVFAVTGMVDKAVHAVTQIMFVDSKSRRR